MGIQQTVSLQEFWKKMGLSVFEGTPFSGGFKDNNGGQSGEAAAFKPRQGSTPSMARETEAFPYHQLYAGYGWCTCNVLGMYRADSPTILLSCPFQSGHLWLRSAYELSYQEGQSVICKDAGPKQPYTKAQVRICQTSNGCLRVWLWTPQKGSSSSTLKTSRIVTLPFFQALSGADSDAFVCGI